MLVGDPSLKCSKIFLKTIIKELKKEGEGILVEYNCIENCLKEASIPADFRSLFDEYDNIFQPLTSLLSTRNQDHAIKRGDGSDKCSSILIPSLSKERDRAFGARYVKS